MRSSASTKLEALEALKAADVLLRRRDPSYDQAPIPIHNAVPTSMKKQGVACPACKSTWGTNWIHKIENCFMHPDLRDEKKEWIALRTKAYVDKTGKQPILYTNWPISKKRSSNESSQKEPAQHFKRERGI
jgi:hypothetical protein